jgi:flagellar motor switch protein FliG
MVKEEIGFLGPVRVADVEAAQQEIVDIARRLEEAGEVVVLGRGTEGELVV